MNRKGIDKVEFAILCVPKLDKPLMTTRFEWEDQMAQIVNRIDSWNR